MRDKCDLLNILEKNKVKNVLTSAIVAFSLADLLF